MPNRKVSKPLLRSAFFLLAVLFLYILGAPSSLLHIQNTMCTENEFDNIPPDLQYLSKSIDVAKNKRDEVLQFLKKPVINVFNTSYKVSQDWICKNPELQYIIVVPTARANFHRRQKFREGPIANFTKSNPHIAYAFFVGNRHRRETTNIRRNKIQQEVQSNSDIVIGDFEDGYKRILTKHVSMLNWVIKYCPHVKFVLRIDDDIILPHDIHAALLALKRNKQERDNFILGSQRVGDRTWRPVVPKEDYAPAILPPYVLGGAIGYPVSTVKLLLRAAQRIRTVWLDDMFITGICAKAVGIPTINDVAFRFLHGLNI